MAAVLTSPEDVINAALSRLGTHKRIGSIYDGTEDSRRMLDIYSQTRDAILRQFAWDFANKDAPLTLLKTAPVGGYSPINPWNDTYPPMPWIFEYAYPDDMVKLRTLRDPTLPIPNFDPRPKLWSISADTIDGNKVKVIVANLANAVATYTFQSTDPSVWDSEFTEAMIDALLRRFTAGDPEMQKIFAPEEAISRRTAESLEG